MQCGRWRLVELDCIRYRRARKPCRSGRSIAYAHEEEARLGQCAIAKAHQSLHIAEIHCVAGHDCRTSRLVAATAAPLRSIATTFPALHESAYSDGGQGQSVRDARCTRLLSPARACA